MSILQDYEKIGNGLTKEQMDGLELYLKFHPEMLLSDLYYSEGNWEDCQEWLAKTPVAIKEQEPIYLVVENYKGICEHNFLGTKEEILKELEISEREFDKLFRRLEEAENDLIQVQESNPTYYVMSNVSYDIHVCQSKEDLEEFMNGKWNDTRRAAVDPDWYFNLDKERCGSKGLAIIDSYKKEKAPLNDKIIDASKRVSKDGKSEESEKGLSGKEDFRDM